MEEMKMGQFIRDRRLQLGLTQQQLADRLEVTDKAVSKWERSVSYPDITLLRQLAEALEVSVTELLAGEREAAPSPVPPEVEDVVVDTVSYAETARRKNGGWRWRAFIALTALCGAGALVCLIFCCMWQHRHWALLALRCIAFGWAVCYPLLRLNHRPVRGALVIVSVFLLPLLWSMGVQRGWQLGIMLVSLAYAWAVYWIFLRFRRQIGYAAALILPLGVMLHVSINYLVDAHLAKAVVATGGTLFLDALCLAAAWTLTRRRLDG